jgi:hypothetical protein
MTLLKNRVTSLDRIDTVISAPSNENHRKLVLPNILKTDLPNSKRDFMLSLSSKISKEVEKRIKKSESPFGSIISPFKNNIKVQNLGCIVKNPSFTERKQNTINKNISCSTLWTNDKENVSNNINPGTTVRDGFNATFSKNGSIPAAETTLRHSIIRESHNSVIEVTQLDQSSDEDTDFNRSESEISNLNDVKTKFSTNQSAWNLSDLSTPVNIGKNHLTDNEASKKYQKFKLKKGAIKYINKNKGSRINLRTHLYSSEINDDELDLVSQNTRNQHEIFDGTKRMILMLDTEFDKDW